MLPVVIGIIGGNFLYQYFGDHNWAIFFDRTYFQLGAIGMVLLVQWWDRRGADA